MMMAWGLLAEVKNMNFSALVICWEESNNCSEDNKHFSFYSLETVNGDFFHSGIM